MPRKKTWRQSSFFEIFLRVSSSSRMPMQVLIWALAGPACRQYVHGSTAFLTSVKRAYCLLLDAHVCPDLKSSFGQRICGLCDLWLTLHLTAEVLLMQIRSKGWATDTVTGKATGGYADKEFYHWSVKKSVRKSVHAAVPMKCCLYLVIFKVTQEVTQEEPLRYAVLRYFQKFCGSAVVRYYFGLALLPHYRNQ